MMLSRALFGFYSSLGRFLQNPVQVFWFCLSVIFVTCVLDGSLLHLWALHRDKNDLHQQVAMLKIENQKVKAMIKRASDPTFIEREAMDRFDLVEEGDLVFVFSEDN
jgi:cell division protein FtsB